MTAESETSRSAWIELFAEELGVTPPDDAEVDDLLAVAGTAAHASERTAAPLSTWLVGRAGIPTRDARDAAARVEAKLRRGE